MAEAEKKEKILVIEGDSSIGESIISALKREGYEASLASNAVEGLKAILDTLPHLVILDVTLPDGDGYEVLKKKIAEPMLAKVPVFLMSMQGVPINMRQVPEGSVTEFLTMLSLDPQEILDKVNRQFGHEKASMPASGPGSETKKKLLWVEDDKLIGTILARKLVSSGFDLFHAKNGEEALEALKDMIPDMIVVDLLLPGMNGFDLLQKISEDERLKKIPSMILSNLSKPSDIERGRVLGAKKFMVKATVSLDQIVAAIRALS